jgi:7,8-dihydroneopterin aldolase/epimerase/oxygenase
VIGTIDNAPSRRTRAEPYRTGEVPLITVDRIILAGIECYAHGGVSAAEKEVGQRYRVDLELGVDTRPAASSDAIEDAVHYGHVHDAVVASLRSRPFSLLESAADRIATVVLERFPVERVTVRLAKLLPPIDGVVASAAVEITRERIA